MKVIKKQERNLPCQLTEDELKQKAKELATTVQEISADEDRSKNIKDQLKATMSELSSRQTRLAGEVARGEVYRLVDVEYRIDDEGGLIQEVRMDSGETFISRPARDEERQLTLQAVTKEKKEGKNAKQT